MLKYTNYTNNFPSQNKKNIDISKLKPMKKNYIVCGKKNGLPFDYLMTDVMSGCINLNSICYGNCTAALFWLKKGYNFGKNTMNIFDPKLFEECVNTLPKNQKWIRQGWMSDCSLTEESWKKVADVSSILAQHNISLMIITKIHKYPSHRIMKMLAKNNTEIRVSLSALDTDLEIEKRFKFLLEYKEMGGISIPYLMSAKYKNKVLKSNQKFIIEYIVENDFIAGEHPLRISKDNPLIHELCDDGFYHPKFEDQYWFGRILYNVKNFMLPAPTHLKPEYHLTYKSYSSIPKNKRIPGISTNLPTYIELKNNKFTKEMFDHAAYSIQKN